MCTFSFIISYPDIVSWSGEGIPRDVKPAVAGKELVGMLAEFEVIDEGLELCRITRADVGSLAEKVLGCSYAADSIVVFGITEAGVDDDRSGDQAGWL